MDKAKEIKYNILSKTANNYGVFYFTKDNINYIGNVYAVIRGMNDKEFKAAIDKTKAKKLELDSIIDFVINDINEVKKKGCHAIYTKLCFNSSSGLIHFFISDNNIVINLYDEFYVLVKDHQVSHIFGLNPDRGLVFELDDGKEIMILSMNLKLNDEESKILEKVLDIL